MRCITFELVLKIENRTLQVFSHLWSNLVFSESFLYTVTSVSGAAKEWPIDSLIDPPAEPGHRRVDSRKPRITTAVSPGDHAIDPSPTHQGPAGVPLQGQRHTFYQLPMCLTEKLSVSCNATVMLLQCPWLVLQDTLNYTKTWASEATTIYYFCRSDITAI